MPQLSETRINTCTHIAYLVHLHFVLKTGCIKGITLLKRSLGFHRKERNI